MTRIAESLITDVKRSNPWVRVTQHIRTPLYRNGYSLAFSSVASSALGMLFWLVAARLLPPEVVGIDSALIAASGLIGTIAQLNLTHALNRFLPRAGTATGVLILCAYTLTSGLAVILAVVFILGIDLWSPSLALLSERPALAAWFVVATALSCVFVLQDGVLAGLRRAGWVPIENIAYGVAKLLLLAGLVIGGVQTPVFVGWTAPYVVVLAALTWLLFRRLVPEHVRRTADRGVPIDWPQIRRFVAGDYAASLVSTGTSFVLPLLVLELTDPASSAYFALAWSIAYTLFLLSRNMGMSLVAEAANDESRLEEYSYNIAVQSLRLLAAPVLILLIAAPLLLSIFGGDYAQEGATVLRLLGASAIPGIAVSLFMARARIQRRMRALVVVMTVLNGAAVGLSVVLVPRMGITGVGVAWLAAHTIVAAALLATDLRDVWVAHVDPRILAALVRILGPLKGWSERRRGFVRLTAALPSAAIALREPVALGSVLATCNEVSVAALNTDDTVSGMILKVANSEQGDAALRRQERALRSLAADDRLVDWEVRVPRVFSAGEHAGRWFLIEERLPGVTVNQLPRGAGRDPTTVTRVLSAIDGLHRRTATTVVPDEAMLAALVDHPLEAVADSFRGTASPAVDEMRDELRHALTASGALRLSRIHGDLSPRNVLFDAEGQRVLGLVDWEDATTHGLPEVDRCHLFLTMHMQLSTRELGDVVNRLLREHDRPRTPPAALTGANDLAVRTTVLLTWLHHVATGIAKSTRGQRSPVWHARNVASVLQGAHRRDTSGVTWG